MTPMGYINVMLDLTLTTLPAMQFSDITGDYLSDYMHLPYGVTEGFIVLFHICSRTTNDLLTHLNV